MESVESSWGNFEKLDDHYKIITINKNENEIKLLE